MPTQQRLMTVLQGMHRGVCLATNENLKRSTNDSTRKKPYLGPEAGRSTNTGPFLLLEPLDSPFLNQLLYPVIHDLLLAIQHQSLSQILHRRERNKLGGAYLSRFHRDEQVTDV